MGPPALALELDDEVDVGDQALDRLQAVAQGDPFAQAELARVQHRVLDLLDQGLAPGLLLVLLEEAVEQQELVE